MNSLRCRVTYDAERNLVLQVQGALSGDISEPECILRLSDLKTPTKGIRLESVVYAFQEKLGCILHWKVGGEFEDLLPLEARGNLDFETRQGFHSPKDVEGLYMTTYGCGDKSHLFLLFDISKQ